MADDAWYLAQDGQQAGPMTVDALRQMAAAGQVRPDDMVWTEGMPQWLAAGAVPAVFPPPSDDAWVVPGDGSGTLGTPAVGYPAQQGSSPAAAYAPHASSVLPYGTFSYGTQVEYAGFWLRFCAAFVDGLITGVAGLVIGVAVGFAMGLMMANSGDPATVETAAGAIAQVLSLVLGWLYEAMFTSSSYQARPGKMMLGLRVTDLAGGRISFGRATGRHFGKIVSGIILLIGYIMAAFTEKRQALHDIMAGTLVVRRAA